MANKQRGKRGHGKKNNHDDAIEPAQNEPIKVLTQNGTTYTDNRTKQKFTLFSTEYARNLEAHIKYPDSAENPISSSP